MPDGPSRTEQGAARCAVNHFNPESLAFKKTNSHFPYDGKFGKTFTGSFVNVILETTSEQFYFLGKIFAGSFVNVILETSYDNYFPYFLCMDIFLSDGQVAGGINERGEQKRGCRVRPRWMDGFVIRRCSCCNLNMKRQTGS